MENQDSPSAIVEQVPVENPDVQSTNVSVDSPTHHQELKTLNRVVIQDGPDAGKDEQVLVHTRSIGDKNYTVKKINLEGSDPSNEETEEVATENNLTCDEVCTFQEDWDKNWNPSLDQPKEGGVIGFFKKMLGYE